MKYTFPVISSIDVIRDAIADSPEFVEANKGDYIIFNYNVHMPNTFPPVDSVAGGSKKMRDNRKIMNALRRECRGIVFSPDGKLIARRLHKFFNMGERDETHVSKVTEAILEDKDHLLIQKLDGSMITPIPLKNGKEIVWGTKMGHETEVAIAAQAYIDTQPQYLDFAKKCIEAGITPIFEYTSPSNKIVVPYKETKLVLIAMRNNLYGNYFPYVHMRLNALKYSIPSVERYNGELHDIKSQEDIEGAIILFSNGHMVKVKCDWYVNLHKTFDSLQQEKNVLLLILSNQVDDLLPNLSEEDKEKVIEYQSSVFNGIVELSEKIISIHRNNKTEKIDRKTFALVHSKRYNSAVKSFVFESWDYWEKTPEEIQNKIIQYMLKLCNTQTQVNMLHEILTFKKWVR